MYRLSLVLIVVISSSYVWAQDKGGIYNLSQGLSSRQQDIINQANQDLQIPPGVTIVYADIDYYGTNVQQEDQHIGNSNWLDEENDVVIVGINFGKFRAPDTI